MAVAQKLEVKLFVAWPEKDRKGVCMVFACLLVVSFEMLFVCFFSLFFLFCFGLVSLLVSLFVCADCLFLQSCSLHDLCSQ